MKELAGNVGRDPTGQALLASLTEPVPVSALPGDDPSRDFLQRLNEKREYLLLASYCGDDNPKCSERKPCADCLTMCNVFRVTDLEPTYLREFNGG